MQVQIAIPNVNKNGCYFFSPKGSVCSCGECVAARGLPVDGFGGPILYFTRGRNERCISNQSFRDISQMCPTFCRSHLPGSCFTSPSYSWFQMKFPNESSSISNIVILLILHLCDCDLSPAAPDSGPCIPKPPPSFDGVSYNSLWEESTPSALTPYGGFVITLYHSHNLWRNTSFFGNQVEKATLFRCKVQL